MKILLATDGSDYSRAAIDYCRNIIAKPSQTSLRIISAVDYLAPISTDPMGASAEYYLHLETAARDQAKDYVEKADKQIRALFPRTKLDVKTDVIDGSPPQVIV